MVGFPLGEGPVTEGLSQQGLGVVVTRPRGHLTVCPRAVSRCPGAMLPDPRWVEDGWLTGPLPFLAPYLRFPDRDPLVVGGAAVIEYLHLSIVEVW